MSNLIEQYDEFNLCFDYDDFESTLRPCDLILISSPGIVGKFISIFEMLHTRKPGTWIHAGVVCPQNIIDIKNKRKDRTYILESLVSGFDGINNIESNKWHNGVQIRDLKKVVISTLTSGGKVACMHLKNNMFPLTIIEENKLNDVELKEYYSDKYRKEKMKIIKKFWGKYSKSKYDFINCARSVGLRPFCCFEKNTSKCLFCSEMVVYLYQDLGLIGKDTEPEKVSPEELGKWCGDIKGEKPFEPVFDLIQFNN